jgi:hypothetical protein
LLHCGLDFVIPILIALVFVMRKSTSVVNGDGGGDGNFIVASAMVRCQEEQSQATMIVSDQRQHESCANPQRLQQAFSC